MGREAYIRTRSLKKNKKDFEEAKIEIEDVILKITEKNELLKEEILELQHKMTDFEGGNISEELLLKKAILEEILLTY